VTDQHKKFVRRSSKLEKVKRKDVNKGKFGMLPRPPPFSSHSDMAVSAYDGGHEVRGTDFV
jgi:hypothetical protein